MRKTDWKKKNDWKKKIHQKRKTEWKTIHTCTGSPVVCPRMLIKNEIEHDHQQVF